MKKIFTQSTSLFLATTMLFASCAGHPDVFDVTKDELEMTKDKEFPLSVTIQKIDSINANLPEPTTDVNSRGVGRVAYIASKDIEQAGICGIYGFFAGGFIGACFAGAGAIPGAVVGAFVGGLIGAVGGSYEGYQTSKGWEEFYMLPEDIMDVCAELEEEPDSEVAFEEIEVPDSIKCIGYIHNLALDALINNKSTVSVLSNEPPFLDKDDPGEEERHHVITFTQFDRDVIASDIYMKAYNQIYYPEESQEPDEGIIQKTIFEEILDRYISAFQNYSSPLDSGTVLDFTNQYISVVKESTELSEADKNSLYIAFSVGVYSFKYWSNFDFETSAEEE